MIPIIYFITFQDKSFADRVNASHLPTNENKPCHSVEIEEVLSVEFQLFDGLADVLQGQMAFLLAEQRHDLRLPEVRQNLNCADIKIAIVEIGLKLWHVSVKETAVLADGIAADRAGLRRDILADEFQRPHFCFAFRDALAADAVQQA